MRKKKTNRGCSPTKQLTESQLDEMLKERSRSYAYYQKTGSDEFLYPERILEEKMSSIHPGWRYGNLLMTPLAVSMTDQGLDLHALISKVMADDFGEISKYPEEAEYYALARSSGRKFIADFDTKYGPAYFVFNHDGHSYFCHAAER